MNASKFIFGLLLLLGSAVQAQDGPGGVGDTAGSTALEIWLKADDGTGQTVDGNAVSNWTDKSGNGNDFAQGTGANQPLYKVGILNGQPVVRFDGTDDYAEVGAVASSLDGGEYGVIVVGVLNGSLTTAQTFVKSAYSSPAIGNIDRAWGLTSFSSTFLFKGLDSGGTLKDENGANAATATILSGLWNADDTVDLYLNGTLGGSGTDTGADAVPSTHVRTRIGADSPATPADYLDGDIAEVIVFSSAVSAVQRKIVENHLSAKYDITIASDLYAGDTGGNGNYDHDVIGVGAEADGSHVWSELGGLILDDINGALDTAGDYVFGGHDNTTNALVSTDITGSVEARWDRIFYLDKTGTLGADMLVGFDMGASGLGGYPDVHKGHVLLYRAGTSGNFSEVIVSTVGFSDDQILFEVTDANLVDGYYTIGVLYGANAVSPDLNEIDVLFDSDITLSFTPAISAASLSTSTIAVHGYQNGRFSGTHGGGGTSTVTFTPSFNFLPGEEVEVSLTAGVTTETGNNPVTPLVWRFVADADPGPVVFSNGPSAVFDNFGTAGGTDATTSVIIADLDFDGVLDLAVGNGSGQNAAHLNDISAKTDGADNFDTYNNFGPGDDTGLMAVGDADGDDYLDIAVPNSSGQQNAVYFNDGSGAFPTSSNFGTGTDNSSAAAFGDIDGDGDVDLFIGQNGGQDRAELNDGAGNFSTTKNFGGASEATIAVRPGDFDLDGDLDVAVASVSGTQNRVFANDGAGNFSTAAENFGNTSEETRGIYVADADGDGFLDVAVANISSQQNRIYQGDGAGGFTGTSYLFGTGTDNTRDAVLGDLDGDGDLDIALGNDGGQNIAYLNNGSGSFSGGVNFGTGSDATQQVALGDLDYDGVLDIALANYNEQNVVYFNELLAPTVFPTANNASAARSATLTASFTTNMHAGNTSTFAVFGSETGKRTGGAYGGEATTTLSFDPATDFNPGEVVEVVFTTGNSTSAGAFVEKGVWRFTAAADAGPAEFSLFSVNFGPTLNYAALGDADSDGDLDIAISVNAGQDKVFINSTGLGDFPSSNNVGGAADNSSHIAFADVDGDGNPDLGVSVNGGQNTIYFGDGDGTFDTSTDFFGTGSDATKESLFGDLNGDGYLDVAVGNDNEQNEVYFNDGNGTFLTSDTFSGTGEDTYALALGDVDNDGDLDIAEGNIGAGSGEQNVVYFNSGDGEFITLSKNFGTGSDRTRALAIGDLDADGDLDLTVGNNLQQNVAYLNDGSGDFSAGSNNFGTGGDRTEGLVLGDVDGDGDLDVGIANDVTSQNVVELNDGSGAFTAGSGDIGAADSSQDLAFGDIDGDGDLDAAVANASGQSAVWFNKLPTPQSFAPFQNDTNASSSADITATFALAVSPGSATSSNFVVRSSFSGAASATSVFTSGASLTLNFNPVDDFHPGETVEAVVTKDITTAGHVGFQPYVWRYRVAAGTGPADFSTASKSFGTGSDGTNFVALGDIDFDGDLDAAVGNQSGGQNVVYPNDGYGNFSGSGTNFGAGDTSTDLAFGDADNDGDLDIAVAIQGGQNVVYLYSGGSYGTSKNFGTGSDATFPVAWGDLDGDGYLDIAVGNISSQQNVAYLNDGSANFSTSENIGSSDITLSMALGDMDNDGDLDVAVGNSAQNVAYYNDGAAKFDATGSNFGGASNSTDGLAFGDLDADGDLDLVLGNNGQQNTIQLNDGKGIFSGGNNWGTGSDATEGIALGDLDGDGDLDVAAATQSGQNAAYLQVSSAAFSTTGLNFGSGSEYTTAVALGDLDGDLDLDIIAGNLGGSPQNFAYLNESSAGSNFNEVAASAGVDDGAQNGQAAAWGDIDLDGDIDLFVGNEDQSNRLYRNDGTTFAEIASTAGVADAGKASAATFADYDNDGDLDLHLVRDNSEANRLYRNDGSVTGFTEVAATAGVASAVPDRAAAWGDLDNDGDLDLYVSISDAGVNPNKLYRNDGTTFAEIASGAGVGGTGDGRGTALADFDDDGDLDIYLANYTVTGAAVNNKLYRNDGSLSFIDVAATWGVDDANDGSAPAFADYDRDGDLDLYLALGAGGVAAANKLYRNDGTVFAEVGASAGVDDGFNGMDAAWGDLDNDGDLDLYVSNNPSPNSLYRNDGSGTFEQAAASVGMDDVGSGRATAWGDYDNDGDLDLYLANYGTANRLYRNEGAGNNWLRAKLTGTTSNKDGVGAQVSAVVGSVRQRWDVGAGSGRYGMPSLPVEFGFGTTTSVDSVVVRWASGLGSALTAVAVNQELAFTEPALGKFADVGSSLGVDDASATYAVAWGDYDGDGDADLYSTNNTVANKLYRNDGGTFAHLSAQMADTGSGRGTAWGDADNDGDLDLYLVNESAANRLYRNDGADSFSDIGGTTADASAGQGAAWADYDNDGDLDLYLANNGAANKLYRNDGSNAFVDAGGTTALNSTSQGVAWADADTDGDPDLYVVLNGAANKLYRNDGGAFVDLGGTTADAGAGRGAAWGDLDNDGDLELYLANATGGSGSTNRLYRNDGSNAFVEIGGAMDVADADNGHDVSFGDFNNDGNLDLYVGNDGSANLLYYNRDGTVADEVGNYTGVDIAGPARVGAFADYDGDGDLDLYVGSTGGSNPLYRNDASGNNWLKLRLTGTSSNKAAIGARVRAVAGAVAVRRDVDGGSGHFSQNAPTVQVGLGAATSVDSVQVYWPSGRQTVSTAVMTGQTLALTEPLLSLTAAAAGLSGASTVAPGGETQIFSIGITGDGAAGVNSLTLTLSDLTTATGITAGELSALKLYSSTDAIFDSGDALLATQSTVAIGSATTLTPTAADVPPSGTVRYYIATATIAASATDGHAFKVGFAAGGLSTAIGGLGAAIAASDGNIKTIDVTATQLVFTAQPAGATHLQVLTTTPVIAAQDANGNLDTGFGGSASLAISPAGGVTNNTATFLNGQATFSTLTISGGGSGRTLTATSGSLSGTSASFDVAKAQATVTLNNLAATYDGDTKAGGAATVPSGLPVTLSYAGLTGPPTGPGSFTVTATVSSDDYQGSATGTLVISQPPLPTANLAASATDINPGQSVTFTNQSSGFITGNFLETGQGSNSFDNFTAATVTYNSPGTYTAVLTVSGPGGSATASQTVTVRSPPVLAAIPSASALEDAALVLNLGGKDSAAGTWAVAGGSAELIAKTEQSGESFTFTPVANASGSTTVTVTRTGPTGLTATQDVQLMWTAVDDPPQISGLGASFSGPEDAAISLGGAGNAVDIDTAPSALVWEAEGFDAKLVAAAAGGSSGVTFTPVKDAFGQTTAKIRLKDATTAVTQDVTLMWTPVNDPPTVPVIKGPADGAQNVALSTPLSWEAMDVDGDVLVYDVSLGAAGALAPVAAGQMESSYNALGMQPGTQYGWKVVVRDPAGASAEASASFTTEADRQAPVISMVSATAGEAGITVVWSTDESANSQVRFQSEPDQVTNEVDSGQQTAPGPTTKHAITLTPQRTATWYNFEVRSEDLFNNVSAWVTGRFYAPAAPDAIAPIIAPGTIAVNGVTETSIWITWTTDELSNSIVRYSAEAVPAAGKRAQAAVEVVDPTPTRNHSVQLTGLTAGTAYRYTALSRDEWNNESLGAEGRFTTARVKDVVAPGFTDGPGTKPPKVESAEVVVGTDETTTAQVRYYVKGVADAQVKVAASTQPKTSHAIALAGLMPGTAYEYSVRIEDESGNFTESGPLSFSTRNLPDIAPPVVEGIGVDPKALSAVFSLRTNEPTLLSLSWWPAADATMVSFTDVADPAGVHALTMGNLQAATAYQYEARIKDEADNALAPQGGSFTTAAAPDLVAPAVLNSFVDNQRLESTFLEVELNELGRVNAALVLLQVASVQPRAGKLAQAATEGRQIGAAGLAKKHRVPLTSLEPGAQYRVDYTATDGANNQTTGSVEFTAARQPDTQPPQPVQLPGVQGITDTGARVEASYNEDVQFEVRYWPADNADAVEQRGVTKPGRNLSMGLSPLLAAKNYIVAVVARDGAGLVHETQVDFITLAGADLTAPVFEKPPWQDDAQATSARLKMVLDEPVTGEAVFSGGTGAARTVQILDPTKAPTFDVTGLEAGTQYDYTVTVQDANKNAASATGQVKTAAAAVPPAIVEGPTRNQIEHDKARIGLKTDKVARVEIAYFPTADPTSVTTERPGGRSTDHSVLLTNLTADTDYNFEVQAFSGALASARLSGSFKTRRGPDLIKPQLQGNPTLANIADTRARISWNTDEPSDSKIVVRAQGAAKAVAGAAKLTQAGGQKQVSDPTQTKNHEIEVTGLLPGTTYSYDVISRDLAGNETKAGPFSFTTAPEPDLLPPEFTRRPVVLGQAHDSILLGFSANEIVSVKLDYGLTTDYELGTIERADQVRDYELRLSGLTPATTYHIRIGIIDVHNNGPTAFPDLAVTTEAEPDTEPAIILTGPVLVSSTEAEGVIEWSTNEPATRLVRYWPMADPQLAETVEDGKLSRAHRMVLSNLEPGTAYQYEVASLDAARNGPTTSGPFDFRTKSTPVDPVFTLGPIAEATESSVCITWTTNVPATSIIDLGETLAYGTHLEAGDLVQNHEIVVRNLKPGTVYHYKVTSVDLGGKTVSSDPAGLALFSKDLTVRTPGSADTKAPALVANPTTVWTNQSVVVSWETDEVATSRIEWAEIGGSASGFVEDNQQVQNHSLTVTGLRGRTLYAVKVISEDAAGNRMVWQPSAAAKAAAKAAFDTGLRDGPAGKVAQPPGGAGTFVTDSFPDSQLPVITGGPRVREKTAESLTIEWETDELADSFVRYGGGQDQLLDEVAQAQDVQVHSVTLTNLAAGTSYFFRVESTDPSGNGATISGIEVATTQAEADLVPPRYLAEPTVQGQTDDQAVLGWRTDEAASATIEYWQEGQEPVVRQVRQRLEVQQVALTNLLPATNYRAKIWVQDATQNQVEMPFELGFATDAEPDFAPPRLAGVPEIVQVTDQTALIAWRTDELADAFVDYDLTPYLGGVIGSPTYGTEHEVLLTNLERGAEYFYRVGSTDRAGNGPVTSEVLSFTTLSEPDREAPATPDSLVVVAGAGAVFLQWDPVVAADLGGYAVYREDSTGVFQAVATRLDAPRYLDEGLVNGRTYRYKVAAADRQNPPNESAQTLAVAATPNAGAVGDAPEIGGLEEGATPERPVVLINNAVPLDAGIELSYTVQVSTARDFSTIVDRGGNIAESLSGVTRWRLTRDLNPRTAYWFRTRAYDGRFESPWSPARTLRPRNAQPALTNEDFDGDGVVGFGDFFLFASGFGSADAVLDLDRGGAVDQGDLRQFAQRFGSTVSGKRQRVRRVETIAGSNVELHAEAFSADEVVVRLQIEGVEQASGYGFHLRFEPPILRLVGRLDSTALGGAGASLQLAHEEEGGVAIGEHLRGRQPAVALDGRREIALLFEFTGPPRDVDLRVSEGVVGAGRGRALKLERVGAAQVVPQVYALYANYPNPFNPTTVIPLAIPGRAAAESSLVIYNALGQQVRRWDLRGWRPGFHQVVWDGRDRRGRSVASGVYLVRLAAGDFVQVRKVMLLR